MKKILVAAITLISINLYAFKLNLGDIEYDSDSGQLSYYSPVGEKKIVENMQIPKNIAAKRFIVQSNIPKVNDQSSYLLILAREEFMYAYSAADNYWLLEKNGQTKNWSKVFSGRAYDSMNYQNSFSTDNLKFIVSKKLGLFYLKTSSTGEHSAHRWELLNRVGLEYLKNHGNFESNLDQTIGSWSREEENNTEESDSAQTESFEKFLELKLRPNYLEVLKLSQVDKYWDYSPEEKEQAILHSSIDETCKARIAKAAIKTLHKNIKLMSYGGFDIDLFKIRNSKNYIVDVTTYIKYEDLTQNRDYNFTVEFTKKDCRIIETIYLGVNQQ